MLFLAAYLAETADVIANARPWSLKANSKYLGPLFIGWGASMAILVVQRDLGMATLLLATFATLLYVATRRVDIVVLGAAIFAVARLLGDAPLPLRAGAHRGMARSVLAIRSAPAINRRKRSIRWRPAACSAPASGSGQPGFIPDVATDYVYAAFTEEFGLAGAIAVLAIFLALLRRIFAAGLEQPDLYAKLLATGLGATLGFQVFIIVGGVIGVFPADRHHAAVHVVRRQFAGHQLPVGRARMGDFGAPDTQSEQDGPCVTRSGSC